SQLESLPNEIIHNIGSYLKGNDLVSFSNTSQRMSKIVRNIKFTERNFCHTPATENIPGPLNERLTQAFGIRQAMAGNATGVFTELMALRVNYQKVEEANRVILNHFHPQSVDYSVFRGRLVNEYIERIRNKYGVSMNELPADIRRMHQERINNYYPSVLGETLPL
ncbi:F-box protein, partial [Enterobacter bugandensis]|uniref:F-box protein n=1 Tax=Enterobacter bugandensis TaxID=881260 RepID=UPI000ADA2D2E